MADQSGRATNNRVNNPVSVFKKTLTFLGPVIGTILTGITAFGGKSDFWESYIEERWKRPDIIYSEADGVEIYKCDIELKDGTLVLYPQFVITEGDRIIRMIHLGDLYSDNVLKYNLDINGFHAVQNSMDSLYDWISEINCILSRENKSIEIQKVILMELEYKNAKADEYNKVYYKMQNGQIYPISENDIEKRGKDYELHMECLTEGMEDIIRDCKAIMTNQKSM